MSNESVPRSWICPQCRRRVPVRCTECRCGSLREEMPAASVQQTVEKVERRPTRRSGRPLTLDLLALAGAGFLLWTLLRPGDEPPDEEVEKQSPAVVENQQDSASSRTVVPIPMPPASVTTRPKEPERYADSDTSSFDRDWRSELPDPEPPRNDWGTNTNTNTGKPRSSSSLDSKRDAGRRQLEARIQSLAVNAKRLVSDAQSYQAACSGRDTATCQDSLRKIVALALVVGKQLSDAEDLARKSWLPAGEVRELREKYGLDHGVWDQAARLANRYARR